MSVLWQSADTGGQGQKVFSYCTSLKYLNRMPIRAVANSESRGMPMQWQRLARHSYYSKFGVPRYVYCYNTIRDSKTSLLGKNSSQRLENRISTICHSHTVKLTHLFVLYPLRYVACLLWVGSS
jgi:hypothetical protein